MARYTIYDFTDASYVRCVRPVRRETDAEEQLIVMRITTIAIGVLMCGAASAQSVEDRVRNLERRVAG